MVSVNSVYFSGDGGGFRDGRIGDEVDERGGGSLGGRVDGDGGCQQGDDGDSGCQQGDGGDSGDGDGGGAVDRGGGSRGDEDNEKQNKISASVVLQYSSDDDDANSIEHGSGDCGARGKIMCCLLRFYI